jgi:dephospho-CoA kinase
VLVLVEAAPFRHRLVPQMTMRIRLFGLTGGMASGKSTVAARFRERGLEVIDADQVAREVVEPCSEGLAAVVETFGEGVLGPDGRLDRATLAARVFGDPVERRKLEGILHPRIAARTRARAQELADEGVRLACYEAALLVENGLAEAFRPLVVVAAPRAAQIARIASRDGLDAAQAEARIAAQLPLEAKVSVADHVIDNAADRAALIARADEVLDAIVQVYGPMRTG